MSFQGPQPRLIKKNQRNPELLSMLSSKLLKNCFYSDNYAFLSLFLFFFCIISGFEVLLANKQTQSFWISPPPQSFKQRIENKFNPENVSS